MSPTDPATWHTERTNMPSHTSVPIAEFAPKAWAAICELLGGEERVSDETRVWSDNFIVNLGVDGQGEVPLRELDGWTKPCVRKRAFWARVRAVGCRRLGRDGTCLLRGRGAEKRKKRRLRTTGAYRGELPTLTTALVQIYRDGGYLSRSPDRLISSGLIMRTR
jgi:hypothetical protein